MTRDPFELPYERLPSRLPVFPLSGALLLPRCRLPLNIFEPRYRRMISDALSSSGQIAMACFEGEAWRKEYAGTPPLRPAVCIGHIVQHQSLPNGRHNVLLQGVCRAIITRMVEPGDPKMYRLARLRPLESDTAISSDLAGVRRNLSRLLHGPRLKRMHGAATVMQWLERDEISTPALIELMGFLLIHDNELKYKLLAEACPRRRAEMLRGELKHFDDLVRLAEKQKPDAWPKGVSWN